jgi:eukaryotic-like serine/threonine-protein kinase
VNNGSDNGDSSKHNGIRTIRFGVFEADLLSGEIRKAGNRIRLQEQPFKVLRILLEHAGDLVTREQLQTQIWPEESFGDFDHAVNIAVGKLRAALGDSAENPSFIETVPRRGYRFIGKPEGVPSDTPPRQLAALRATRTRTSWRRLMEALGAAVACAVFLGFGVLVGQHTAKVSSPDFQRVTFNRGTIYSARFTPDGQNVLYAASWNGAPIEVFSTDLKFPGQRQLGLSSTQLLSVSSSGEMAVLHPAENRFLLTVEGTLGQVPLAGGSPRPLAENIDWADWDPKGRTLAVVRDVNGKQRLECPIGHALYETAGWISHPRFSPTGDQIAFLDHPVDFDDRGTVSLVNLAGHKITVSKNWESTQGLAWSADGATIWYSAAEAGTERSIYAVSLSGRERLVFRAPGGVTLQDIAADGRVLLTRDESRVGMMALSPVTGKEQELSWREWSVSTDISKDGRSVLFQEEGVESGPNYTVAVRDLKGSPPIALGEGSAGSFSPDGKWVTATVSNNRLLLLPIGAGSAKELEKRDIEAYCEGNGWMPDGQQVVFCGNRIGHAVQCFVQNIDGGAPQPLTPEGVNMCAVSPDGKLIAAITQANDGRWLYGLDGSLPHPIPGIRSGEKFAWSSDPHYLCVYDPVQIPARVYRLNVNTGQRKLLLEIKPQDVAGMLGITHLNISPDQHSYVYSYLRLLSELFVVKGLN